MTKEEYVSLSNAEKVAFLNSYRGRTKNCKDENEFVWGYAIKHANYTFDGKEYIEMTAEVLDQEKEKKATKTPTKRVSKKANDTIFTEQELEDIRKLLKNKDSILSFASDYSWNEYLNLKENKHEAMVSLRADEKKNKCFRVNTSLLECMTVLEDKLSWNETELINYCIYQTLVMELGKEETLRIMNK